MNYFLDTEFLEGTQKTLFGHTKPTIDLISIGIVAEDGREYYAISKDFNLKEAWNRYDIKTMTNLKGDSGTNKMKVYWIRDNVLYPIFIELAIRNNHEFVGATFTYELFKKLINKYGKSNKQIAEEVYNFCSNDYHKGNNLDYDQRIQYSLYDKFKPKFYGYGQDKCFVFINFMKNYGSL